MRYTVTCADDATWQFGDSNTVVEDDAANLPPCMSKFFVNPNIP